MYRKSNFLERTIENTILTGFNEVYGFLIKESIMKKYAITFTDFDMTMINKINIEKTTKPTEKNNNKEYENTKVCKALITL